MALRLRQPRLHLFSRSICAQCRPFSASTAAQRRGGGGAQITASAKGSAQPSYGLQQKKAQQEMMESGRVFEEFGVLPETFVTQPMSERPTTLSERWEWERARLKARLVAAYQLAAVKYYMVRLHDPSYSSSLSGFERLKYALTGWYKFDVLKVTGIAKELYTKMYTGLAKGDMETLRSSVKRDMLASLVSRIEARGKETTSWNLVRWVKSRCVAYQVALIDPNRPKWRQSFMQQAVIELESEQSLVRKRPNQAEKKEEGRVKEYVVLQKEVVDGVEGKWRVWGTTKPTTLEEVRQREQA